MNDPLVEIDITATTPCNADRAVLTGLLFKKTSFDSSVGALKMIDKFNSSCFEYAPCSHRLIVSP